MLQTWNSKKRGYLEDAHLLIFGMEFARSKQSKPLSHVSIGSPEAYLIDSFNSIFLNCLPTGLNKADNKCKMTRNMEASSKSSSLKRWKLKQLLLELDPLDWVDGWLWDSSCWRSFKDNDRPVPSYLQHETILINTLVTYCTRLLVTE